jgi:hypothetical protein
MIDFHDIQEYIEETYNDGITVYDHGSNLRVTNGSAGFYADIQIGNNLMKFTGVRYSSTFNEEYEPTEEDLKRALSECLGL